MSPTLSASFVRARAQAKLETTSPAPRAVSPACKFGKVTDLRIVPGGGDLRSSVNGALSSHWLACSLPRHAHSSWKKNLSHMLARGAGRGGPLDGRCDVIVLAADAWMKTACACEAALSPARKFPRATDLRIVRGGGALCLSVNGTLSSHWLACSSLKNVRSSSKKNLSHMLARGVERGGLLDGRRDAVLAADALLVTPLRTLDLSQLDVVFSCAIGVPATASDLALPPIPQWSSPPASRALASSSSNAP